jgi:hypothetical protein
MLVLLLFPYSQESILSTTHFSHFHTHYDHTCQCKDKLNFKNYLNPHFFFLGGGDFAMALQAKQLEGSPFVHLFSLLFNKWLPGWLFKKLHNHNLGSGALS